MKKNNWLKRGSIVAMSVLSGASLLGGMILQPNMKTANADSYRTVDVSATMQTMDGWGTSLCWWANAAGGWDMEGVSGKTKREEIVDLAFGESGLDLNIARYNIPGGDDPAHDHMINCRGMTLLKPSAEAEYDWNADANQMWILDAAYKLRNKDLHVETFNNSAPYWMTNSGCSSGGETKSQENLPVENYGQYAEYYADVVDYLQTEMGIPVSSVEVMNEPGSDYWGAFGSQEGCKIAPGAHQSALIKTVYDEIQSRGLKSGESGEDFIFAAPDETNPGLAYSSYNKLDKAAKDIVGKLNYHIYSKNENDRKAMSTLAGYSEDYSTQENKLWQSEICYGTGAGRPEDYPDNHNTMLDAFDIADDIYGDLYHAKVNAWIIWQIMESELENLEKGCNYGLIHGVYQEPGNKEFGFDLDAMALNRGDYFITKQYYALGQYSRYIKPGYKIVQSPSPEYVIAVSPEKDETVVVYKNANPTRENVNLYLKGFEGTSAKKIVTDTNLNWAESDLEVSGGYLDFTANPESITTVVIQGALSEDTAGGGLFFKKFIQRSQTLHAEFKLEEIGDSTFTFYYADEKAKLPVYGGTEAESERLAVKTEDCTVTVRDKAGETYYGVLARESGGKTTYSRVLQADGSEKADQSFTYLTLAGRTNKMSLAGTGYSFGENYGVADQPFGEDPFTGKQWGYMGDERATAEYGGDGFLESARYSDTDELSYRYEVENNVNYTVSVLFLDPWNVSDRDMEVYVNGKLQALVGNTNKLTSVCVKNVTGLRADGKRWITVMLKKPEGGTQAPAVNLISIQTEEQAEQVFGVKPVKNIVQEQGRLIREALPDSVDLITSKGITATDDIAYTSIDYTNGLKQGGGSAIVRGVANGKFEFQFPVATQDKSEETYYYIDAGALDPTTELTEQFELFKLTNPHLINTDAIDKYAENDGDWGRLGTASNYKSYWENYPDKMESIIEGLYPVSRENGTKHSIQYRLTDLPAGSYAVIVGVDVKTWGSNKREIVIEMGETELGRQSGYGGVNEWTYAYEKTDDNPVIFTVYSRGTSNPVLSYVLVKKLSGTGEKPNAPFLPSGIVKSTTEITVTNINAEGGLLVLTDGAGKLIAEHAVTASEAAQGSVTFTGLDLSGSESLRAVQFKDGVSSSVTESEFASFSVSKPRIEWSPASDVISVFPSGSNIKAIDYRDGADGEWIDIKKTKFFRAPHNGTYYVRLTTTDNVEIIETVEVTHVDLLDMEIANDLSVWIEDDFTLTIDFAKSLHDIVSVKVFDGETETDVTDTEKNKKYFYRVTENGKYTIRAVGELGTEKTFEITVDKLEKTPANLSYELKRENGGFVLEFTTESAGNVEYSYNVNGGEFETLYQNSVPLIKEGNYVYKLTNVFGKEAKVNVVYCTALREGAAISATAERSENAYSYRFTFGDGLTNARMMRLDGKGGEIALENGCATVNESGAYAVIAEKGDTLYITSIFVNLNAREEKTGGCASSVGSAAALAACALGTLGTVVWIGRKKKHD